MTIEEFSRQYGLMPVIDRAISYHPQIRNRLLQCPVEWSGRLQTSAGYASSTRGITLHHSLQMADQRQNLIETFLHEAAHMMQHFAYGEINHGATWWEMMHQLGQKPKRTHAIAAVKRRREVTEDDLF